MRATEETLITLLFVTAGLALAAITPAQNDTWWHLRSGLEMWATGGLIRTELFSYSNAGATLYNHWWLSQLLFYGLYTIGGPVLLSLGAGIAALAAVLGAWRLAPGAWEWRLAMLLILLLATAPEWSVRPQVISLAFLVLTARLIARDRLAWLPVVCALWANCHAMVVFGVGMAGAVWVESMLASPARRARASWVLAACALAPLASPLGWHYWPEILTTVSSSRELGILEYSAPLTPGDAPFWLIVALMGYSAVVHRRTIPRLPPGDRALLIAAAGLSVASLLAARNVAFFAVVAVPAVSRLMSHGVKIRPKRLRPATWPAYVVLAVVAVGALLLVRGRWRDGGEAVGWRPLSADTIAAVRNCPGPMFNALSDGGPLMWFVPERPVFVDSRIVAAYPSAFLRRAREAELGGPYAGLFEEFGIRCALVEAGSPLDASLAGDSAMHQTHRDAMHALYARNEPGPQ